MTIDSLKQLFERDLQKLRTELDAYSDEDQLWILEGSINNTAGNLMLHICGNLQHFVGAVLGQSGYIRTRDKEFGLKNVPRAEIESQIDETMKIVSQTLDKLTDEDLNKAYPLIIFNNQEMSTNFFLIHLSGHLMYHLGQINYHRRLLAH